MAVVIGSTSGYMWMDSWILANIIQLSTRTFCQRFLGIHNDPGHRQYDQMTQAARSAQANIAEGISRHQTSRKTEMQLLDVARASLSELAADYLQMLLAEGEVPWSRTEANWIAVHSIKLDHPNYSSDLMHDVGEHILRQRAKFAGWSENADMTVAANSLLIMCGRLIKILQRQIERLLEQFAEEGGFTENLTETRLQAKTEKSRVEGAPNCPICGKPMIKRVTKKGTYRGHPFWGCSDWPACDGKRPCE